MRACTLLVILLSCQTRSNSQITRHHGVFWGRLVLSDRITKDLKWELYLQKRTQNIPSRKNIFEADHFESFWLWFNYNISNTLKVSASPFGYFNSYAFLTHPSDADIPGIKEFRWVARAEQEQKLKFLNYSTRLSIEYRRRDIFNNDVYMPNWRIRFMPKLEKKLNGILKEGRQFSVYAADEIFIQFGEAVRQNPNVFDQNRISAGVSAEVFKNVKLSLSYLNIIQQRLNGKDFDDAHVIWMILTFDNLISQMHRK